MWCLLPPLLRSKCVLFADYLCLNNLVSIEEIYFRFEARQMLSHLTEETHSHVRQAVEDNPHIVHCRLLNTYIVGNYNMILNGKKAILKHWKDSLKKIDLIYSTDSILNSYSHDSYYYCHASIIYKKKLWSKSCRVHKSIKTMGNMWFLNIL